MKVRSFSSFVVSFCHCLSRMKFSLRKAFFFFCYGQRRRSSWKLGTRSGFLVGLGVPNLLYPGGILRFLGCESFDGRRPDPSETFGLFFPKFWSHLPGSGFWPAALRLGQ